MITRQDVLYLYAAPRYETEYPPDFLSFAVFTIDKSRAERILALRAGLSSLQEADQSVLLLQASDPAPLLYEGPSPFDEDDDDDDEEGRPRLDGSCLLEPPEQDGQDRALTVTFCTLTVEKDGFSWRVGVEYENDVPGFGSYDYKILEELIGSHEGGAK